MFFQITTDGTIASQNTTLGRSYVLVQYLSALQYGSEFLDRPGAVFSPRLQVIDIVLTQKASHHCLLIRCQSNSHYILFERDN